MGMRRGTSGNTQGALKFVRDHSVSVNKRSQLKRSRIFA